MLRAFIGAGGTDRKLVHSFLALVFHFNGTRFTAGSCLLMETACGWGIRKALELKYLPV